MARPTHLLATYFLYMILNLSFGPSLCCPQDQREALLQFKSLLVADLLRNNSMYTSLLDLESWNSSSDCCQWKRVACHNHSSPQQVTGLILFYLIPLLNLNTAVTSDVLTPLFRIRSLMLLDISGNSIQGDFPGFGFANLTNLVHLDMSRNGFNGSIPPQLFQLKYLQYLDLSSNSIEGTLSCHSDSLTPPKQVFRWPSIVDVELRKLVALNLQNKSVHGDSGKHWGLVEYVNFGIEPE
ncbi:hypothetical protein F0562_016746 [Nyssa sinensis]|uniref:Leucine-rich repeat-containing N-terminal plant-type domain-containing protein n=1 Tax=Nyssa sinensis TaxID=561372 RepID=A0A5J4ZCU5_9ASTE|nr:hypothetical protein F0562_016746 [Nyssa sinensis]